VTKRHVLQTGDWQSVFGRLEELVLANSGEDEFEEIFKLLVAKLLSEKEPNGLPEFASHGTAAETADHINRLIAAAARRWPGIISGSPEMRLTSEHLAICVEAIEGESILDTTLEALDGAFEYLVGRSAKGSKGQYFTPRQVIDCCVRIAAPRPEELVVDPACGSAGFLIHTALSLESSPAGSVDIGAYARDHLWGFDFDQRAVQVAKALMLVAGDGHSNLYRLNSLVTPKLDPGLFDGPEGDEPGITIEDVIRARIGRFKGFDVVLTNPPFAGEIREKRLLEAYELYRPGRRIERDVLFLERCIELLRPGGRIGIVLPHNKLGGSAWGYCRQWLLRRVRVVAVLGLGRNTFLPHTHQKADIVFGVKRDKGEAASDDEEILFLVSERPGKDSRGRIVERAGSTPVEPAWIRADHDLDGLVEVFHTFVAEQRIPWPEL
jgi:type I restriction enzyme M protein